MDKKAAEIFTILFYPMIKFFNMRLLQETDHLFFEVAEKAEFPRS